jgi:hypothetical protein
VSLPDGADEDDLSATYDRGILTVSVPLSEGEPAEKHVEVYEIAPLDEDEDDDDYEDDGHHDDEAHDEEAPVDEAEGEEPHQSGEGA